LNFIITILKKEEFLRDVGWKIDYNQIVNMCVWVEVALGYVAVDFARIIYDNRISSGFLHNIKKTKVFRDSLEAVLHLEV